MMTSAAPHKTAYQLDKNLRTRRLHQDRGCVLTLCVNEQQHGDSGSEFVCYWQTVRYNKTICTFNKMFTISVTRHCWRTAAEMNEEKCTDRDEKWDMQTLE